jgi:hypothetical protein
VRGNTTPILARETLRSPVASLTLRRTTRHRAGPAPANVRTFDPAWDEAASKPLPKTQTLVNVSPLNHSRGLGALPLHLATEPCTIRPPFDPRGEEPPSSCPSNPPWPPYADGGHQGVCRPWTLHQLIALKRSKGVPALV